jgi:hypothetical protein
MTVLDGHQFTLIADPPAVLDARILGCAPVTDRYEA